MYTSGCVTIYQGSTLSLWVKLKVAQEENLALFYTVKIDLWENDVEERRHSFSRIILREPIPLSGGSARVLLKFKWIPEIKVYFKLLAKEKRSI